MQPKTTAPEPAGFLRRNLLAVTGVGIVALAGLAWLAFGYFGIHTAFIDDKVEESGPVFASGAATDEPAVANDPETSDPVAGDPEASESAPPTAPDAVDPQADDATEAEIVTVAQGTFSGVDGHSGSGGALVLNDGSEQRFLRFEEFEVSNGPDLNVYLTVGGDVDAGFVDLGDLKGNIGSQNYEIPPEVDLGEFDTVMIWCVRFGVGFAEAALA